MKIAMPKLPFSILVIFCCLLAGCASNTSTPEVPQLNIRRITYVEPAHDSYLKMQLSPWSALISGKGRIEEEQTLNYALSPLNPKVLSEFTEAFVHALEQRGYHVIRVTRDQRKPGIKQPAEDAVINGYIEAGFVYKTIASDSYEPYVQAVVEMSSAEDGRVLYHKLFVASNRSYNPFMTTLPSKVRYSFKNIEQMRTSPDQANEALAGLAAQLGTQYGEVLLKQ